MTLDDALVLYEFLRFSGRLWMILWHSRPDRGFPIVRSCFAVLEDISLNPDPEHVAPALKNLLGEINLRSPGVVRIAMRPPEP